jgi:hypothetical protein
MSWTCPECKRSFRNPGQSHSCELFPLEKHFEKRPPVFREIFDTILDALGAGDGLQINSMKEVITLAQRSTFLAFRPRKDYIELEIINDTEIDEFPVFKTFRISKKKVVLYIRVQDLSEIDDQLLRWIRNAHEISRG